MIRSYEIPVVFRVHAAEAETQQAIDQVVAWIENSNDLENPGKVTRIDRTMLGRRRLAYEIDGQRDGLYVLFYADLDTRHLPELELNLKLYNPVLRYLIVHDETQDEKEDESAPKSSDSQAEPDSAEEEETRSEGDTASETE